MAAQNVEDVKAAIAAGREAMAADPALPAADKQKFEAAFANPEAVLERVKRIRRPKK